MNEKKTTTPVKLMVNKIKLFSNLAFLSYEEMRVLTDEKRGNPPYSMEISSFSSCLDQVWHIRGKLSSLFLCKKQWHYQIVILVFTKNTDAKCISNRR